MSDLEVGLAGGRHEMKRSFSLIGSGIDDRQVGMGVLKAKRAVDTRIERRVRHGGCSVFSTHLHTEYCVFFSVFCYAPAFGSLKNKKENGRRRTTVAKTESVVTCRRLTRRTASPNGCSGMYNAGFSFQKGLKMREKST